jgi:hypothetical protein
VAYFGAEYVKAVFPDCLSSRKPRDLFRSVIERRNDTVLINSKHTVTNTVKDEPT